MRVPMKMKDVPPGGVFSYCTIDEAQFIKLNGDFVKWGKARVKCNVINVVTWTTAFVQEDADVVYLGMVGIEPEQES